MRILGQSGNQVFERYYQSTFITGLQQVSLLRPPQAALCQAARQIRGRDPNAPTRLRDDQLQAISRDPRIRELRQRRNQLKIEIKFHYGTIKESRKAGSDLSQEHREVCKELEKTRRLLR